MAKKRKGRLIPVKKTIFDTHLGKSITRTYYMNPDKSKHYKFPSKKETQNIQNNVEKLNELAQKLAFCNW